MVIRIKAIKAEFKASCTNGCVYGEMRGKRGLYVYAELGQEKSYIPSPNDDPKTEYRLFTGCSVFFAKTQEKLNQGEFEAEDLPNVTVIIYC
ncbi:hypothetical protein VB715_11755 [Crocosphaera sp. UHCC 0190]|uniref:hypothetical protein n=1 Tax=Crocosphaera sp. UHCC 0190 TaxID=3110246 RepID=UPI002B21C8E3|nr:hypothetical protein [Crocosphaera sp. UHCC 0190]MEA5510441.1 hypothetical protein [Crocosphaera sp. UHCC 0190]